MYFIDYLGNKLLDRKSIYASALTLQSLYLKRNILKIYIRFISSKSIIWIAQIVFLETTLKHIRFESVLALRKQYFNPIYLLSAFNITLKMLVRWLRKIFAKF